MSQITKKFNYNAIEDKGLATFLKGEETAIRAASRRAQGELIEIGHRLEAAKERAGHGLFMKWTEGALGYTHRHAMGFIHVAQTFGKMEFNSNLPLSQTALFALAAPSVSDETREVAMELAATGELKTTADAKALVEAAKPPVVEGEIVESNMQNSHIAPPTNPTLDNAHNDDIADDSDDDDDLFCANCEASGDMVDVEGDDLVCQNCGTRGSTSGGFRFKCRRELSGNSPATDDDDPFADLPESEPTPAEQCAAAPVVSDNIDEPSQNENDLTDDEWLMTLPIFKLLVARGDKALILRTDALAWRTMQQGKAFGSFRHHAQKAFDFKSLETPFARLVYKASHVRHPREWTGCVSCRGAGCTICGYSGAVMDGGLTIEQMEARK